MGEEGKNISGIDLGEFADLVEAYWTCQRLSHSKNRDERLRSDEYWWAWEEVQDRTETGDADAFRLLVALADAAVSDDEACGLGAGPLENLIEARGSDETVIARTEGWAQRSRRFRRALSCVWYSDAVPPSIVVRLQRAASA